MVENGARIFQIMYFTAIGLLVYAVLPDSLKFGIQIEAETAMQVSSILFLGAIATALAAIASKGQQNLPVIRLLPLTLKF